MPNIPDYLDTEEAYEVRDCETVLACGACNAGYFAWAGKEEGETTHTLHICNNCGRELMVEGEIYPRLEFKRVLIGKVTVTNPGPAPDLNAPPEPLTAAEIDAMTGPAKVELLRSTIDPDAIMILRQIAEPVLHIGYHTEIRNGLYDIAAEVATLRAASEPVPDCVPSLAEVANMTIAAMVDQLLTTHSPEIVDQVKQVTVFRLMRLPEIRKALFDVAEQGLAMRQAN